MSLLYFLEKYIFSGIPSQILMGILKRGWEKANERKWEDVYIRAFQKAFHELQPILSRYGDDFIDLDIAILKRVLHQELAISISTLSLSEISAEEFSRRLAEGLSKNNALVIGGHNLSEQEYTQLVHTLIIHAKLYFKNSIIENDSGFRKAVLSEAFDQKELLHSLKVYLINSFDITLDRIDSLERKLVGLQSSINRLLSWIEQNVGVEKEEVRAQELSKEQIETAFSASPVNVSTKETLKFITVIIRSTADKVRDGIRIRQVYGTLITFPGRDRFVFYIFERGRVYRIEFPNFTTGVTPELIDRLQAFVSKEDIRIESFVY